ncbi:MAG: hypothetical protein KFH98_01055 [Gemmatimonadetes bacterium]|nr:hypothetical protein [Gemmatimonadota bacterium]
MGGTALTACVAALVACSGCYRSSAAPPEPDPDPQRARAALATLHVDNQTPYALTVSYRIAGHSGGQVDIGRIAAVTRAEMAPVPAGEPLILVARTTAGGELTLPPRTFAMDGTWTWRLDRAARFVPTPPDTR